MIAFGASSYAVLGMMYFVLTVMLLTSWRGPRIGGYLIGAGIAAASKKRPIINAVISRFRCANSDVYLPHGSGRIFQISEHNKDIK
jgi:hypothetical protein